MKKIDERDNTTQITRQDKTREKENDKKMKIKNQIRETELRTDIQDFLLPKVQ